MDGIHLSVWAAIDPDTKELLAVYSPYQRSSINRVLFIRIVLNTCMNNHVLDPVHKAKVEHKRDKKFRDMVKVARAPAKEG